LGWALASTENNKKKKKNEEKKKEIKGKRESNRDRGKGRE
jgi:hypothetical protein